jgi:hypothetical protein
MKKIILLLIILSIAGCMSGMRDHNSLMGGPFTDEPAANNNYQGGIVVDPITGGDVTYSEIKQKASSNCSSKGGLKIEPYLDWQGILSKKGSLSGMWKYQCHGVQQYTSPTQVNTPAPIAAPAPKSTISIEAAKQQCKDIGYKPGTEKFGNCVLELSK